MIISVVAGEEISFDVFIEANSDIEDDVIISYRIEEIITETYYSPIFEPVCGDNILGDGEICDDGLNNGKYGYCSDDCSGIGSYCGDGFCDMEEDSFLCSNDCGKPSFVEKVLNFFNNIFSFTGFASISAGSETIYVGNLGDKKTIEAKLHIPSNTAEGSYYLITDLNYRDYKVSSFQTIEVLYSPMITGELAPIVSQPGNNLLFFYVFVLVIGIMVLFYFILKLFGEIKRVSVEPFKFKRVKSIKKIKIKNLKKRKIIEIKKPKKRKGLTEENRLIKKILNWKGKGYNTSLLERRLEQIKLIRSKTEQINYDKRLKEWEDKGYDTSVLRHNLGLKSKVLRVSKSDELLLKNIRKFENKIKEWNKEGYDVSILKKKIKKIETKILKIIKIKIK